MGQSLGLELPDDDTMFYITLTIEEEGKEPINITTGSSGDSDMDSTTYSHLSTDSSNAGTSRAAAPPPHRRKSSCSRPYSVVRPLVPPPAPPTSITKTSSGSFEGQDSLLASQSSQEEKVSGQEGPAGRGQEGQVAPVAGNSIKNFSNVFLQRTYISNVSCIFHLANNCRSYESRQSVAVRLLKGVLHWTLPTNNRWNFVFFCVFDLCLCLWSLYVSVSFSLLNCICQTIFLSNSLIIGAVNSGMTW